MVRGDVGDDWPFRAPPRSATTVPSWNIDTLLPTPPPSRIYVKSNLQKGPNRLGVLAFKLVTCNDELRMLIFGGQAIDGRMTNDVYEMRAR